MWSPFRYVTFDPATGELTGSYFQEPPPEVIDAMFYLFQGPNHCENAYKKEQARYNCPPEMRK